MHFNVHEFYLKKKKAKMNDDKAGAGNKPGTEDVNP